MGALSFSRFLLASWPATQVEATDVNILPRAKWGALAAKEMRAPPIKTGTSPDRIR